MLFQRIVERLGADDDYFKQRPDALGKMGATTLQKVTAAIRLLAYGGCADQLDEWIHLSESTIQEMNVLIILTCLSDGAHQKNI